MVRPLLGVFRKPGVTSVLYLAAFFPENAGYEYRVRQWAEKLEQRGIRTKIKTVFAKEQFERLRSANAMALYLLPLYKRFFHVLQSAFYGRVIVRRELVVFSNYGNGFIEKLLLALHPDAVLDFDDDLSPAKHEPRPPSRFEQLFLYQGDSFNDSLRLYKCFMPGSLYLKHRIKQRQPSLPDHCIQLVPTCVDYDNQKPKDYTHQVAEKLIFGWIGGNGNQPLLDQIIVPLNEFASRFSGAVELHVISGNTYTPAGLEQADIGTLHFKLVNKPWSLESQLEDLRLIDVGIMPLNADEEQLGKCGFKLIQYMGLGIVSMASAVTVNNEIISQESEGFLVPVEGDWLAAFEQVAAKRQDFAFIGKQARARIAEAYTFHANEAAYLDFLSRVDREAKTFSQKDSKVDQSKYVRHSRDIQL